MISENDGKKIEDIGRRMCCW